VTPAFIRRAAFALLATLVLCGVAVWVYEADPMTAARTVSDRLERNGSTVEEVRELALDETSTPAQKHGALRFLCGRVDASGQDGRSAEVVTAMTAAFAEANDGEARSDLLRQLRGVSDPVLLSTLLEALRTDSAYRVREAAAGTLEGYIDVPGVREALIDAGDHDADPRVTGMAYWVLHNNPDC